MAATVARPMIARGLLAGIGSIPLYAGPEKANLAGGIGTPLISTSGYVEESGVDAVADLMGLSTTPGHNNAADGTTDIEFVPFFPQIVFEATLEDETNNNHALVATNRYLKYAIQKDATNDRWYLDENDVTNVAARVIKLVDAIGTVKGRVEFVFLASKTLYYA